MEHGLQPTEARIAAVLTCAKASDATLTDAQIMQALADAGLLAESTPAMAAL
jgi:hypothetical protein